jgi:hypothetical protein
MISYRAPEEEEIFPLAAFFNVTVHPDRLVPRTRLQPSM